MTSFTKSEGFTLVKPSVRLTPWWPPAGIRSLEDDFLEMKHCHPSWSSVPEFEKSHTPFATNLKSALGEQWLTPMDLIRSTHPSFTVSFDIVPQLSALLLNTPSPQRYWVIQKQVQPRSLTLSLCVPHRWSKKPPKITFLCKPYLSSIREAFWALALPLGWPMRLPVFQ